jgi:hypothetical protein
MEQIRDFKGVWIPKNIWLNKQLNFLDKVILIEIDSLNSDTQQCFASNQYFADFCQCSPRHITRVLTKLVNLGYIKITVTENGQRYIQSIVDKMSIQQSRVDKMSIPPRQNVYHNNINNNTSSNNNINNINNNKQEYIVEINRDDKIIYTGFKEILDKDKEKGENEPQKPVDNTNTPKTENNAKKAENKPPELNLGTDTKPKNTKKKFEKPTIGQIAEYAKEAKLVNVDPNAFFDHFESNGWKVSGISPMKDWKAAMRNWNRRALSFTLSKNKTQNKGNIFYDRLKEMEEQENNGVIL